MLVVCLSSCTPDLGQFEGRTDIGDITIPGAIDYDGSSYTVGGSGWDLWADDDGFHYVWKQVSGDLSIAADIEILGEGGHPNKKAFVMIRQDLDKDAVYADAVIHASGLASIENAVDVLMKKLTDTAGKQEANTGRSLQSVEVNDFESGNTVIVNGWILSLTEARQCALYSFWHA